ncbi:hypothetical protein HK102_002888 [Quaeritorhiza haematococci]|nr:hypothetical protein HK102_002888 [Quaeritorhiza haematococci]
MESGRSRSGASTPKLEPPVPQTEKATKVLGLPPMGVSGKVHKTLGLPEVATEKAAKILGLGMQGGPGPIIVPSARYHSIELQTPTSAAAATVVLPLPTHLIPMHNPGLVTRPRSEVTKPFPRPMSVMTTSSSDSTSSGMTSVLSKLEELLSPRPAEADDENSDSARPFLFRPMWLRSVDFKNRIVVSPMCMYSCEDGFMNLWHLMHLGQYAARGAGLVMFEATAVTPNGRISPNDAGIWTDGHAEAMRPILDFIHSQSCKAGLQIAHAGRKASCLSPFYEMGHTHLASEEYGGWPRDIVAPSAIQPWETAGVPRELSKEEIREIVEAFAAAARRADQAGFDVLELHGAHGYLIHSFLSPISNKRTDEYGGSFENRIRFLLEIVTAVRRDNAWPDHKPLFVRLSCTDWLSPEDAKTAHWEAYEQIRAAVEAKGKDKKSMSRKPSSDTLSTAQKSTPTSSAHNLLADTAGSGKQVSDGDASSNVDLSQQTFTKAESSSILTADVSEEAYLPPPSLSPLTWDIDECVALVKRLKIMGVDFVDCSSSGIHPLERNTMPHNTPGYNVPLAERLKRELDTYYNSAVTQKDLSFSTSSSSSSLEEIGKRSSADELANSTSRYAQPVRRSAPMRFGVVGKITDPHHAEDILKEKKADMVFMAREFLRSPNWVMDAAKALGVGSGSSEDIIEWAVQYERGRSG